MIWYNYDGSLGGVQVDLSIDEIEEIISDYLEVKYSLYTAGPLEFFSDGTEHIIDEIKVKCITDDSTRCRS